MIQLFQVLKKSILSFALFLFAMQASAQLALIKGAIDTLEKCERVSYQFTNRYKDFSVDTSVSQHIETFLKTPADKAFGYYFRLESTNKPENFHSVYLNNPNSLVYLNFKDSTYGLLNLKSPRQLRTLFSDLKGIWDFASKHPSKCHALADTTIDGNRNAHIIEMLKDTLVGHVHCYAQRDLFIDRRTAMPTAIIARARDNSFGNGISNYFEEMRYFDFKLNQPGVDKASFDVPRGFHPAKAQAGPPALLLPGTLAPGWTLQTDDGKKVSLAELKGKVVLLDFYFIGCGGCMLSIKPLNELYEKYKGKNIEFVSLTERDNAKTVLAFDRQYGIKYPALVGAMDVVKAYHVSTFPTFYLIDQQGQIASVNLGYDTNFEENMGSKIKALLIK